MDKDYVESYSVGVMCMCGHLYFICKASLCLYACKCRGQRRTVGVFLHCLSPCCNKKVILCAGLGTSMVIFRSLKLALSSHLYVSTGD